MQRRQFAAAVLAAPFLLAAPGGARAADGYRVSGPAVHENLAIFFVHGADRTSTVPVTLDEALAKGQVKVHETGNVNELSIENLGDAEVFVHAGDLVKGGRQDRALTASLMLPPKPGRVPIAAFCVEQGRWSKRGGEDAGTFSVASAIVPSRETKLAMKAVQPAPPRDVPYRIIEGLSQPAASARMAYAPVDSVAGRQQEMWRAVRNAQEKISGRVGSSVASPQSSTSLQLSLENEKLKAAQEAYIKALRAAGEKDGDIIGYVFAINGKINSAEVYPSNGLFRKLWGKLLAASVTEAIGERSATADGPPEIDAVQAFLASGERGETSERVLPADVRLISRDADKTLFVESRRADGAWLHRSYLVK